MEREVTVEHFFVSNSVWLSQCTYNLTKDQTKAEDLVQDVMVTILELPEDRFNNIRFGESSLNMLYIYRSLKNRYINQVKKLKANSTVELNDNVEIEVDIASDIFETKFDVLNKEINAYLDELETTTDGWFRAKLFRLYLTSGKSMDQLAKDTKISKSTIFTTIRNVRIELKDKFENQYKELNND